MSQEAKGKRIFISYAHKDEALRKRLDTHLSLMQRQGLIQTWHDRQIQAGTNWAEVIDTQLEEASIILLLVSADFVASDYCYGIEMTRALERHEAKQARVIPIIMRPVDWTTAPFARLQALPTSGKAITSWKNRDEAFADVAARLRKAIEEAPTHQHSFSHTNFPPIWNVPYPRNMLFTGREELLTQLAASLHTGQPTAISQPSKKDSQPQAISGLGGIGKTQLVLEYAYRYRSEYQAVLWAQADTKEALTSSYLELAALLNLPEKDVQESAQVIVAMKQWLQRSTGYLLILDNADDLALAREFVPPTLGGHVLLTTRAQSTGRFAQRIEVDVLPQEQGITFLLRRAGLLSADATLEQAPEQDKSVAKEICEELGGLPLALDQAGAYIEETQCSLVDYRTLYKTQRVEVLRERGGLIPDHPLPVTTTWSLSFQQVEQQNSTAADILRLCAFLAPDAIPENILTAGGEAVGPLLQGLTNNPLALNRAITVLGAYSLAHRDASTHMLSVHRLVQAVLKDQMKEEEQKEWAERTVQAVNETFPYIKYQTSLQCELFLPHAFVCSELIERYHLYIPQAAHLLNQTAIYLNTRARYQEAEPLYERALAIYEEQFGAIHPHTAASLNNLASLYRDQGKYAEAEPLCQRALAIREEQLGAMHPDTAQSLNNLAQLYQDQGKYTKAEPLMQRALAIYKRQLGAIHPDTTQSLNNLAGLYHEQGKYAEAEPLLKQALATLEEQLGAMHPLTATSLNSLAGLYNDQGKYAEAEPLLKRALAVDKQVYGPEHPEVATDLNNLAALYTEQGKYIEAKPLYERALTIREQQLGAMHPSTASSLNNLAALYTEQGKYIEAEPLLQRALTIREQQLGATHPETATSLNTLALLYKKQGKYAEAEPLYQRALAIREEQLGAMHPDTAQSLNTLAALYQAQGKYAQAEPLLKRALAIREEQLGAMHPDTATSLNNLATLYYEQGKYEQAEPLLKRTLSIVEQTLGNEHPNTRTARASYAILLEEMGRG